MNTCELMLKPRNKKQQKQLDDYIKSLELTTKGEIFILNCVLYMDWSRQKILKSIKSIKETDNGRVSFYISMIAPYIITNYSTSTPYGDRTGWTNEYAESLEKRMFYIYHQMCYYTNK